MNRIVRERYPVEKLPNDLQLGSGTVRVTVELVSTPSSDEPALATLLDDMKKYRRRGEDPVARIRSSRSEWDERAEMIDRIRSGGD